jgi:hypothetical protein
MFEHDRQIAAAGLLKSFRVQKLIRNLNRIACGNVAAQLRSSKVKRSQQNHTACETVAAQRRNDNQSAARLQRAGCIAAH